MQRDGDRPSGVPMPGGGHHRVPAEVQDLHFAHGAFQFAGHHSSIQCRSKRVDFSRVQFPCGQELDHLSVLRRLISATVGAGTYMNRQPSAVAIRLVFPWR